MDDPSTTWKALARQGKLDPHVMTQLLAALPYKSALALLSAEETRLLDRGVVKGLMVDPEFRERHSDGVTALDVAIELLKRVRHEQRVGQEKWKKKQQAVDPWAKMAIEKQFREAIKEYGHPYEPATLQYLEHHMEDEEWREYWEELELVYSELHHSIQELRYAQTLVKVLWFNYEDDDGNRLTVDDVMDDVLHEPNCLMKRIFYFLEDYDP